MNNNFIENSSLNINIIWRGLKEILNHLKQRDNFSFSSDLDSQINNLFSEENKTKESDIGKKIITQNSQLSQTTNVLERSTLPRGNINDVLCDFKKIEKDSFFENKYKPWIENIQRYNKTIKIHYNNDDIIGMSQSCRLIVEKTCREILNKIIIEDKNTKILSVYKRVEIVYKKRGWDNPSIFIESKNNLIATDYIEFTKNCYINKSKYDRFNDIVFYFRLILEFVRSNSYNDPVLRKHFDYFLIINRIRNSSQEAGHDLKKDINFEETDTSKMKTFLEWFVNDIAFTCLK